MKLIRNIGAILMVVIFLVPATGFFYTRHSCDKTGEVRFALDRNYSCCAVPAEMHCEIESASGPDCCTAKMVGSAEEENSTETRSYTNTEKNSGFPEISTADENCCLNEGKYLKSEEKYNVPNKAKLPHFEIQYNISAVHYNPAPARDLHIEQKAHSPPLPISSKNVLLRYGVMLI